MTSWKVWFVAELVVELDTDDEQPPTAAMTQAVQDAIGPTGAVVTDALDWRKVEP